MLIMSQYNIRPVLIVVSGSYCPTDGMVKVTIAMVSISEDHITVTGLTLS